MKRKKMLYGFLLFVITLGVMSPSTVCAKSKNVTKTMSNKNKSRITHLCREFTDFCAVQAVQEMNSGEIKTFNFSKVSHRKYAMKFYRSNTMQNINMKAGSRNLFGKSTPKVSRVFGDWGADQPVIIISKIYKTSAKKYKITAKIRWVSDEGIVRTRGRMTFYLKKNKKSVYKFIVQKLRIRA